MVLAGIVPGLFSYKENKNQFFGIKPLVSSFFVFMGLKRVINSENCKIRRIFSVING
jgi:hypothetical protein